MSYGSRFRSSWCAHIATVDFAHAHSIVVDIVRSIIYVSKRRCKKGAWEEILTIRAISKQQVDPVSLVVRYRDSPKKELSFKFSRVSKMESLKLFETVR